jgi:hypothetical protein
MRDPAQRVAVLRIVPQRGEHADCAIATLASLLGLEYETVLLAAGRVTKRNVLTGGLHSTEMARTARALGATIKVLPWDRVDQDEDTGILHLKARIHGESYEDHVVLFHCGSVIDLRGPALWDFDVYVKHFAGDPVSLMVAV